MWSEILGAVKRLIELDRRIEQNRSDITELQRQVRDQSLLSQRLAAELQSLNAELRQFRKDEAREREMFLLRLENTILRSERGLPPARSEETE